MFFFLQNSKFHADWTQLHFKTKLIKEIVISFFDLILKVVHLIVIENDFEKSWQSNTLTSFV